MAENICTRRPLNTALKLLNTPCLHWRNIITEPWLKIANFLKLKQNAFAVVLALPLFLFIAATTGFAEMIQEALRNVELAPSDVATSLLAFCYAIAVLIIFAFTWLLSRSVSVIKSVSALLVRMYTRLRSAYDTRQFAKRRIANAVATLTPQEKAFLELFCTDGVAPQRTKYEGLPHQTYVAHRGLIKNGLVIKIEDPECLHIEHFALTVDAIPLLQKLVYGGKEPQTEIELLLDHVAGPCSSGSPPTGGAPSQKRG